MEGYVRDSSMGRSHFNVKVFDNGDGETLVEFQRIGGCAIAFNKFYYRSLAELGERGHFLRRAHMPRGTKEELSDVLPPSRPDFSAFSLPPCEDTCPPDSESGMRSLFVSLNKEALGSFVDLQRQAMSVLALMSAYAPNQSLLFECDVLHVLKSGLASLDDVVLEHACALLVNL